MIQAKVLLLDENRDFGGAERHVVTLGKELHERGILESVVGRKDSWLQDACAEEIPFNSCGFRNEVDMFSVYAIYKLIKSSGANVLHCIAHRDLVAAALARQLPGAPRTVLLKAEHSFPDNDLSPLFRWAYRQCDGLACVSDAMQRALLEKMEADPPWTGEMRIIANGIDADVGTRPLEPPSPPYKIGVLSALREGKGHGDFLQAMARIHPKAKALVEVSIAGEGPLRAELEQQSRGLGVPVAFHGHCDDPSGYLRGLDLCVLPSHTETFSLVALESLTLGVPLIAADSAGVSELYQERDMLFAKGDIAELAAKIERYLTRPAAFSERAATISATYGQEYSRHKMGVRYARFYAKLLSKLAQTP